MIQEKITSQNAPLAMGAYSQGLRSGDFIFLSGQLPIDPHFGELVEGDIKTQIRQVLKNMEALLCESGLNLSYILKTTVYVTDINYADAVNEVYTEFFSNPYPVRSLVSVKEIALKSKVMIDAFAIDTRALEVLCSQEGCVSCGEHYCETKLDIQ